MIKKARREGKKKGSKLVIKKQTHRQNCEMLTLQNYGIVPFPETFCYKNQKQS